VRLTRIVRSAAAFALVVVIGFVFVADPLFCCDGCGRDSVTQMSQTGSSPDSAGECLWCQAAATPALQAERLPAVAVVSVVYQRVQSLYLGRHLETLDHPPRLA